MSVLSRAWDFLTFRDLPAARPIQTRSAGLTYPTYTVGKPQWLPTDPATLALEGYDKVVVAFACVNVIANAIDSAPMRAVQNLGTGDTEPIAPAVTSSPGRLAMLVNNPNPYESQPEFLETGHQDRRRHRRLRLREGARPAKSGHRPVSAAHRLAEAHPPQQPRPTTGSTPSPACARPSC